MKKKIKENAIGLIFIFLLFVMELVSFMYMTAYMLNNDIEKTDDFMLAMSLTNAFVSTLVVAILCLVVFISIIYECKKEGE